MKILGLPTDSNQKPQSTPAPSTVTSTSSIEAWRENGSNVVKAHGIDGACIELEDGRRQLDEAKRKIEQAEQIIIDVFRDFQLSEGTMVGENHTVEYKNQTRVTWNTSELEKILHSHDSLPAHVKKNLSVDKAVYETLPQEMKNILSPARKVNTQKPKIEVRRNLNGNV